VSADADPVRAPASRELTEAAVSQEDADAVPSDDQDLHAPAAAEAIPLTLEVIQENPELSGFISAADGVMEALGYTEHGFRHANLTGRIAFQVLSRLGYDARTSNLGCVAGYLHDVGNMVSREMHGQTGALLVYQSLKKEVTPEDLFTIVAAIANHEERHGVAVSPASAAVILADKSDVHRSRVRKADGLEFDIHDRVNYAAEQSFLRVNSEVRTITLELTIDTEISQVMEYFEIFLGRMQMCRLAAETLGCRFGLTVNGAKLA
jgi:metal-dependent HD superfamily phosphatase/phosphodiesterase